MITCNFADYFKKHLEQHLNNLFFKNNYGKLGFVATIGSYDSWRKSSHFKFHRRKKANLESCKCPLPLS